MRLQFIDSVLYKLVEEKLQNGKTHVPVLRKYHISVVLFDNEITIFHSIRTFHHFAKKVNN